MNASGGNMAEYTVERKATGKYLKYKIACLALYAAIVLGYFSLTVALSTYGVWVAVLTIPFVPLFVLILRHFIWNRYVNVEYKYAVAQTKRSYPLMVFRFTEGEAAVKALEANGLQVLSEESLFSGE